MKSLTPERFKTISNVLRQRQLDLTVITDEVHKGRNLAAITRTCDAIGIDAIHCVQPKAGFRPYKGTSLGSCKWVEQRLHETLADAIETVKSQKMQIIAAHPSADAVDYRVIDFCQPTALLLGTEKQGLSQQALAAADCWVEVPMMGMVASLNVSVAAAVILAEAQRQRMDKGLYARCQLSDTEYDRRLFQWCHPDLALWCDQRGLNYPPLDDEGDLLNPSAWYA